MAVGRSKLLQSNVMAYTVPPRTDDHLTP